MTSRVTATGDICQTRHPLHTAPNGNNNVTTSRTTWTSALTMGRSQTMRDSLTTSTMCYSWRRYHGISSGMNTVITMSVRSPR